MSYLTPKLSSVKSEFMTVRNNTVSISVIEQEWEEIQVAQKNPKAFRPLYERYFNPIFKFIFRRTNNESLSADICSQVFLKAMQQLKKYTYRGVPFSAWLYRIASNEIAQHFRNQSKNRVVSIDQGNLRDLAEEMGNEDNPRLRQAVIAHLDELKEVDLMLIEMRFFEQRPYKEIAAILNLTESNAKVKTYRILERIRKKLTR